MKKVTHYMYSCDTCCMSREMMKMDGLDSAKCQKSRRRDMMRIILIVNDYCQANIENRNHLFFECQVTSGIWMRVLRLCGQYRVPRRWENELLWVISCKGNSLGSITKRIAWGASIYHLWRTRNARVHLNQFISVDSIFYIICNDVRLRITSFQNVADNPANRDLCQRWSFPLTILRPTRED